MEAMHACRQRGLAALLVCALVAAAALPTAAQEIKQIGQFGDWWAFAGSESGNKICYTGSKPKKEEGRYKKRGQTLILVTHRPAQKSFDVVNVQAGYVYKPGSDVDLTIDGATFTLFTNEAYAWARDAETDRAVMLAMKAGRKLVARGTSSRGTQTKDTYSLSGFTAAHKAINKACGVR